MSTDPSRAPDPLADRRAAYAEDYFRAGDLGAAVDLMRQAVELAPGWTIGRARLAVFEAQAGEREAAVANLRRVRREDPEGRTGADLALATLGDATAPAAAPAAYVEALFDSYAGRFERSLVERLGYRAPDILMEELQASNAPRAFETALDLGCGTGLMGERVRPFARRLDGLDLSSEMLARARAKGLYDHLTLGDLLDESLMQAEVYDLVTAADVLIYTGDLAPVFSSVARRSRPGGHFAFTIETHDGSQAFRLQPSLRYAHSPAGTRDLLEHAGFALLRERTIVVRRDRGEDVKGLAVIAALQH